MMDGTVHKDSVEEVAKIGPKHRFQLDSDSEHKANASQRLTRRQLDVPEWPSQSSYLNPIDSLWNNHP